MVPALVGFQGLAFVRGGIGSPDELPNKAEAHEIAAERVKTRLEELRRQEEQRTAQRIAELKAEQDRKKEAQRAASLALAQKQADERAAQLAEQNARFRKGLLGLLDRFTGRKKRIETQNRTEAASLNQSQAERQQGQKMRADEEIQRIRDKQAFIAARRKSVTSELTQDAERLDKSVRTSRYAAKEAFKSKRRSTGNRPYRSRRRDGPTP